MADLRRDINRLSSFRRFLNGTFPWKNCSIKTLVYINPNDLTEICLQRSKRLGPYFTSSKTLFLFRISLWFMNFCDIWPMFCQYFIDYTNVCILVDLITLYIWVRVMACTNISDGSGYPKSFWVLSEYFFLLFSQYFFFIWWFWKFYSVFG